MDIRKLDHFALENSSQFTVADSEWLVSTLQLLRIRRPQISYQRINQILKTKKTCELVGTIGSSRQHVEELRIFTKDLQKIGGDPSAGPWQQFKIHLLVEVTVLWRVSASRCMIGIAKLNKSY